MQGIGDDDKLRHIRYRLRADQRCRSGINETRVAERNQAAQLLGDDRLFGGLFGYALLEAALDMQATAAGAAMHLSQRAARGEMSQIPADALGGHVEARR